MIDHNLDRALSKQREQILNSGTSEGAKKGWEGRVRAHIRENSLADTVGKDKEGNIVLRKGYFYHNSQSGQGYKDKISASLTAAGIQHTVTDHGDHYAGFKGGAGVRANSHFYLKLKEPAQAPANSPLLTSNYHVADVPAKFTPDNSWKTPESIASDQPPIKSASPSDASVKYHSLSADGADRQAEAYRKTSVADRASVQAFQSGNKQDHMSAASLHRMAASAHGGLGNTIQEKSHLGAESKHKLQYI